MLRTGVMALVLAASAMPAWAADDAFDAMRERWQVRLGGLPALDRKAPEAAALLEAQTQAARRALAGMQRDAAAKALWPDLAAFHHPKPYTASATVVSNAVRLQEMALAYGSPGGALYHDAELGAAIAFGLDWLVRAYYHAGQEQFGNWWSWQIGAPQALLDVLVLAYGAVPAELRQRTLAAVNWHVPDARYRTRPDGSADTKIVETGANLLDKAQVEILAGMLARDGRQVAAGRDAISPALRYVTAGDGFYRDGSFIQHGHVPYAGNYGVVALHVFGRLLHLLNGSDWAIADPNIANVYTWARISFADLLVDGAMPEAVRGRKVAVAQPDGHQVGRSTVAGLAVLAELAPPAERSSLRAAVKGAMQRDRTFTHGYLAGPDGPSLYELGLLKAIQDDPAVVPAAEAPGPRLFPSMDRAILRGKGFAAVLALSSPRVSAYTSGNGENLMGWWQGMGTLSLYDADQQQFGQGYRATVDPRRLPGITTDGSGQGRLPDWSFVANSERWVGGAALGQYAAIGMAFNLHDVTGSSLHGRKSWFQLGDRILALGSGIAGGQGPVETIVENRRLSDAAGARLLVDGKARANGRFAQAHWAHLQDARAGSRIGYVFPVACSLQAERSERQGSWRDVNENGAAQVLRDTYQRLAIPHGSPQYAYLLLPNASAQETRAAAAAPGLRIEANNEAAAAVYLPQRQVYAANLWQAGSAPRAGKAYVWSSGPAAVLVALRGRRMQLAVAAPTQDDAVLEVGFGQAVASVGKLAPGMTVLATTPQLRLRIDTAGAAGASFTGEFELARP
jgi:hyaluronate lyase